MVNLTPNVYAHWKLNSISGIAAIDSSGNGRDGTLINMENEDWVVGKLNNCLIFDGVNEYVDCGDIANFERTDAFSYEFWIKTSANTKDIMSKMSGAPNYKGWEIHIQHNTINLYFINVYNSSHLHVESTTIINNNIWHHVIITYDGSSLASGIHIYIDNIDELLTIHRNDLYGTMQNANNCYLATSGSVTFFLSGFLDEIVIYDKELSQEEITFRWNGGNGRENFVTQNAPSNPDPIDIATNINYNQNLNWNADADDTFDIYFGTSSPPSLVESDHTTSNYDLPNLDSCSLYYWKIVAKNIWGDETSSPEWSFTTNNELPVTPHSNSPVHEATNQTLSLTLSWDCEDYNPNDVLKYDIYFGTTYNPPLVKSNHATKSYNVSGLINDKKYYWKIIAKDNATCGAHETISPIWNFKTQEIATSGHESFDPRKAYRDQLASLWNVNKDCDELEKCIYVRDSKGDKVYIPMYLSEEVKSEQLPALPFLELETVETLYEPQDIGASTRKMSSLINLHLYFADLDNIDRTEFAKKIKDRLHDLSRYYQSSTAGIDFMNIESDTLVEETDGHRVIFHYIIVLYCLYYDTCVE